MRNGSSLGIDEKKTPATLEGIGRGQVRSYSVTCFFFRTRLGFTP